jgi:hypothetical protein
LPKQNYTQGVTEGLTKKGADVGTCTLIFGKNPLGQVTANGFVVSARAELLVQKLETASTPKPLLVLRVTLKTSDEK